MSSPLRSPTGKKSKITTNTSPRRATTASNASPERLSQMGPAEHKQIEKIKAYFGDRKHEVMQELQNNKAQRFEHISNKDQNNTKFNKGKYAYIHKN